MSEAESGRLRARLRDGTITVKVLMRHPMETGNRKDPASGELLPRHFIRDVVCEHNGTPVLALDWGWGIAANPYLAFMIEGGSPGDTVSLVWSDNKGESGRIEGVVA